MTVLLREAIGDRLRHARTNQRRTLRDISRAARVSLGYLSEVERGQKEASSELLASICGALELPLAELLSTVAADVSALEAPLDTREMDPFEKGVVPAGRVTSAQERVLSAGGKEVPEFQLSANGKLVPALRTTIKSPKLATAAA
jgi:transcriptional regulator with XRE-family HTH domain